MQQLEAPLMCQCKKPKKRLGKRHKPFMYVAQMLIHDGREYELCYCYRCGGFWGFVDSTTQEECEPPDNVVVTCKGTGEIVWPPRKRKAWLEVQGDPYATA